MIGWRSEAYQMKDAVPREGVLTVNQNQPVGIRASKCHVRPDIAMNKVSRRVERYQNHANGIKDRSIEGVEKTGIRKSVVRLVRPAIERWAGIVF